MFTRELNDLICNLNVLQHVSLRGTDCNPTV